MKVVCLLSGGMDSLVVLGAALKRTRDVFPVFINYGQKNRIQEEKAFDKICDYYNLRNRKKIELSFFKDITQSALISDEIEIDKNVNIKELTNTTDNYVPFRNTILLSVATAYAETIGATHIYAGNEPNNMNPDNSIEFIAALQTVIYIGTKKGINIELVTPLIHTTGKKEIVQMGLDLGVPFNLSWSCYDDIAITNGKPCGKCEKCLFRKEAFAESGVNDPVDYAE